MTGISGQSVPSCIWLNAYCPGLFNKEVWLNFMLRNKLLYLVILISLFFFFILYIDNISLMIFILSIVFPLIQYFILLKISKNISANLKIENITISKNTESKIIVNITNRSVFPISCATATLKITNTLTGEVQMLTTMLPVSADNEQGIKFSVSYAHCGKIIITLKKIKIYDYIKLFSKTRFLNVSQEIIVVPSLIPVAPDMKTALTGISENDKFSKVKSGDDCSEIFNIKEYTYGDKINRIHWNLTTKHDNLMVKEYSLPISSKILILFEFCIESDSETEFYKTDASIETAMALSNFMIRNDVSHQICWFDAASGTLRTETISSDDDFSEFLGAIFHSGTYKNSYNAFIYHESESTDRCFSHTIYISPSVSDEIYHNLSVLKNTTNRTYLYIKSADAEAPEYFKTTDDINSIAIDYNNISDGLAKVII